MVHEHDCLIFLFRFNERCMFIKWNQYLQRSLHILQENTSGFHILINLSNSCKDLRFLIFWGTMAYILGPKNLTDWLLHGDLYFWSVIKVHY